MVALAILISLGAIAALAYQSYAKTVKTRLSAIQKMTIEDRVTTDFDLILRGVDVGLHLPGTSQPITSLTALERSSSVADDGGTTGAGAVAGAGAGEGVFGTGALTIGVAPPPPPPQAARSRTSGSGPPPEASR
ncbi:MAG: hypothetical protein ACPH89_06315 [Candidatus Puniceispirillaceae bacterium]